MPLEAVPSAHLPTAARTSTTIDARDLLDPEDHIRTRARRAPLLLRHRQRRRIEIGRYLCLSFESRASVLWQIQEVMRIEGRRAPEAIQREIDEYACLVPRPQLLTATLTIHSGSAQIGASLCADLCSRPQALCLTVADQRWPCLRLREDDLLPAAVHYVGFELPASATQALAGRHRATLELDTRADCDRIELPDGLRRALVATMDTAS